jgi:hypothetical protein
MKKNHAPVFAMKYGLADDVGVGMPLARHLGVLLVPHKEHVRGDQGQQQGRDQQHVDDVQPGDDDVARELPAEQEERQVGADDRDRQQHTLEDPQPGAGQQVVGQRVAEQALGEGQREHRDPDQPVDLARLAVGAGEEDAEPVRDDRGHEHVRRPVVDLAHEQAAADVEADVQRGRVRLAHPDAVELGIAAVVDHVGHARLEEQGEESAGEQQDDERVEGDLAQQERPVVREDLPEPFAEDLCAMEPVVEPATGRGEGLLRGGLLVLRAHPSSQKLGPTGSAKSPSATR